MTSPVDHDCERAIRILADLVWNAPGREIPAREAQEQCEEFDVPASVLMRAKKRLGITSEKAKGENNGPWIWRLPDDYRPPTKTSRTRRSEQPKNPGRDYTPCPQCTKAVYNPQPDTEVPEMQGATRYVHCDECQNANTAARRAQLQRRLREFKTELRRVTADGLTPGWEKVDLEQRIAATEKKLAALGV